MSTTCPDDASQATGELGLRDRKRIETRRRLEEAAVRLALDDGIENATIDAISDRAGVSSRTFFNYFDSKEDAILGTQPIEIDDELLCEHSAKYDGADPIEAVVGLLFAVFGPAISDTAAHRNRVEILQRYPQLISRQLAQMNRVNEQLITAAYELLARRAPTPGLPEIDRATAEVILGFCFSAMRVVAREWLVDDGSDDSHRFEQRTIALVRSTSERLR
ncbi:TetR/AcrR family transcriptional regulator [Plantibacter sp. Mn2098]|uniref:TetR/AcrR family transcriptional regulator n=1 Tax=Plantibacter sp. Mn2098 TaxID=3395266 RepID=UPI003BD6ED5F